MMAVISIAMAMSADEVLRNAYKAITSGNGVTATFNVVSDGGKAQRGTFSMSGRKFSLVTPEYGSWYNGQDLWSFSDQTGETTLSDPTPDELLEINPFEIIGRYAEAYTAKSVNAPDGKAAVALTPKDKGASVKRAVVTVSKDTWLPTSIAIDFESGGAMSVNIVSISKPGSRIDASVFTYPVMLYQGVEVVDLR